MVVAVLTINCQVSLKWKSGPETSHRVIARTAKMNVLGRPVFQAAHFAMRVNFEWLVFMASIATLVICGARRAVTETEALQQATILYVLGEESFYRFCKMAYV